MKYCSNNSPLFVQLSGNGLLAFSLFLIAGGRATPGLGLCCTETSLPPVVPVPICSGVHPPRHTHSPTPSCSSACPESRRLTDSLSSGCPCPQALSSTAYFPINHLTLFHRASISFLWVQPQALPIELILNHN